MERHTGLCSGVHDQQTTHAYLPPAVDRLPRREGDSRDGMGMFAFASVIDNVTNDPTLVTMQR